MALLQATWLLFRMHLWIVLRSRRTLVCIVLVSGPPMLAYLAGRFGPEHATSIRILASVGAFLLLQLVVPVLSLVAGSAVVTEEVENRTITYLFTRPIPRAALLLGRWLATLVLVLGMLGFSSAALVWAAGTARGELPADQAWRIVQAALFGGAVYSVLFAVIGVFLKRPMVVGLGYAFAFEGLVANVPGESQSLSIQFYLRSLAIDPNVDVWRRFEVLGLNRLEDPQVAITKLAVVAAFALLIGAWGITRKQYVLTA